VLSASNSNIDQLAETAVDYVELLKKDEAKIGDHQARGSPCAITGKNYPTKKKAS
jgi:hypothetical protein